MCSSDLRYPEAVESWIHRSYAARRHTGGSIPKAFGLLEPALERFPAEPILHYNLACYLLKVDEPDAAKESLRKAIRLGDAGRIIRYALEDADLEPVWPWLRSLPKDKVSGA